MAPIDLWLDDCRPAPIGWHHVRTVTEAIVVLQTGQVRRASLDHDLGACHACMKGLTVEQWMEERGFQEMPNCPHFGTGYNLVCWMEEMNVWPAEKPTVHSGNMVGAKRMRQAIDRKWDVDANVPDLR